MDTLQYRPGRRHVLGLAAGLLAAGAARAQTGWKPSRPVNLIVPWAAGGSTDQVTRATAAELERALGETIVIINQPGASGAIGTRNALAAARDGYTWTSGAAQDLGAYQTLGSVPLPITEWNLYLTIANVAVLCVGASSPYKTVQDVIDAMTKRPNGVSVATAGVTSGGHAAMDLLAKAAKITYDGGNPAVIATVSGEADATTQLAADEADMIRAKRLRPLCTISDKALELEGYGTIPPLSDTLPGFTAPVNYFGIFVPPGEPPEVIATLDQLWASAIANSDALRKYAAGHGALFTPLSGAAAQKAVAPAVQANAWMLFNTGQAKISPASVGIPAP